MELLKMTCFESIVHFVEEEQAFERIEWSSSPGHSDAQKDFERAYNIVKIEIPKLEKEIDDLWEKEIRYPSMLERLEPIEGSTSFTLRPPTEERKKLWDDVRELDQKLEDLIDEVCLLVIKNRNYMWT
jgi:predicted nuclease with TOPRIM domain